MRDSAVKPAMQPPPFGVIYLYCNGTLRKIQDKSEIFAVEFIGFLHKKTKMVFTNRVLFDIIMKGIFC
jgi:hypothetical protein